MQTLEIYLDNVNVDLGLAPVLHGLSLFITGRAHYAVQGDNGAGKTTLLRLLAGEIWPSQRGGGARVFALNGQRQQSPLGIREHVRLVTPSMADWYQHHDLQVPVWEVICAGLTNTPFLYHKATTTEETRARQLGESYGLSPILDRPMRAVSTGQAKRALLARAMVAEPKLLAVDELGLGLDRRGQVQLLDALERIAATGRTRLLVSGHGLLPMPDCISERIYLEHGRQVNRPTHIRAGALECPVSKRTLPAGEQVVYAADCSVVMDGVRAVAGLNLDIRSGQCWAVLGHNGGGKSTLLQMLTGYRRPWPGGRLEWFGEADQFGIARVRSRIGILAPWIKERIEPQTLCRDILLSGLCDGLGVHRDLVPEQEARADSLAGDWGMREWMDKPLFSLSFGQARQIMLARAAVHGPELLVLDEPFSGLDQSWQERMKMLLAGLLAEGRTLVLVTHTPEFMVDILSHALVLEQGFCAIQGRWTDVRSSVPYARLFSAPEARTGT